MMIKHSEVILAGFGGQGILSAGYLLAYAGMLENMHVSWLPSYGPEMRGGTANCNVIISDEQIGSPIILHASALIAMNEPSLVKYENIVEKNGLIIYDSSLINAGPTSSGVTCCAVPATKMAISMGNAIYANMILLGKLIGLTDMLAKDAFVKALGLILPKNKQHHIPDNLKAFAAGIDY